MISAGHGGLGGSDTDFVCLLDCTGRLCRRLSSVVLAWRGWRPWAVWTGQTIGEMAVLPLFGCECEVGVLDGLVDRISECGGAVMQVRGCGS